jgi:cellulose synthase operon protein C
VDDGKSFNSLASVLQSGKGASMRQRSLHRTFRRHYIWPQALVALLLAGGGLGCSPGTSTPAALSPTAPALASIPVLSEEQFAPEVADLLRENRPSPARSTKVASVIQHQLTRAAGYFARDLEVQGVNAVSGALLLARTGELHPRTLGKHAAVLLQAADLVSKAGDEGRARALYELALESEPGSPGLVARAKNHLQALYQWEQATHTDGSMQAAQARRLAAVKRALLKRDPDAIKVARDAIRDWVDVAIEFERLEEPPRSSFELDERISANIAVRTAAQCLVALYLRDGDAEGAMQALRDEGLEVAAPLQEALQSAADGGVDGWMAWYQEFQGELEHPFHFDRDIARAAQWGTAASILRIGANAEVRSTMAVLPISNLLVEFAMPDVVPLMLADMAGEQFEKEDKQREAEAQQVGLAFIYRSLLQLDASSDLTLARRVFENAKPLLDGYVGAKDQRPAPVHFYELMGTLEARAGDLDHAYPLLSRSAKVRPSVDTFRLLSAIERQKGNLGAALQWANQLLELANKERLPLAKGQALLLAHEILLQQNDKLKAEKTLETALQHLLDLRRQSGPSGVAAATERYLAQVLERYGQLEAARRASERARVASANDAVQLGDVLLDESRRALTFSDLARGRLALRHAIEAEVDDTALVYAMLWQQLLELRLRVVSDGTVEEALSRIGDNNRWVSELRQWAAGTLTDAALQERATSLSEKVEADFYTAIRRQFLSEAGASIPLQAPEIQAIAQSSAIELIEVRIARDLSSQGPASGQFPALPAGVVLP